MNCKALFKLESSKGFDNFCFVRLLSVDKLNYCVIFILQKMPKSLPLLLGAFFSYGIKIDAGRRR